MNDVGLQLKKQNTDTKTVHGENGNPLDIHDTEGSQMIKINDPTASISADNSQGIYL